jgi:hypothetical protein
VNPNAIRVRQKQEPPSAKRAALNDQRSAFNESKLYQKQWRQQMKKSIIVLATCSAIALVTTIGSASAQHRQAATVHQRSTTSSSVGYLVKGLGGRPFPCAPGEAQRVCEINAGGGP